MTNRCLLALFVSAAASDCLGAELVRERWSGKDVPGTYPGIVMLLLKILQLRSTFRWSLSNLVAVLRLNLFTYRDLWAWIDKPFETLATQPAAQQLELNFG